MPQLEPSVTLERRREVRAQVRADRPPVTGRYCGHGIYVIPGRTRCSLC